MGKKEGSVQFPRLLDVKVPSFFRCPISLELMQSPVSLSTGVTYDRSSIQRWLDSGHTTCPATMLPLPSTDLVPNLTLRRLIHHWSSSSSAAAPPPIPSAADLLRDIRSSPDSPTLLLKLADLLSDPDLHDSVKNGLVASGDCAPALASVLWHATQLDTLEASIKVLSLILTMDCIEPGKKKIVADSLLSDRDASVSSLAAVLRDGSTSSDCRIHAARVLDSILDFSDPETKIAIAENQELMEELIRLIGADGEIDHGAIDAGLGCLVRCSEAGRRARVGMVRAGAVAAVSRVLSAEGTTAAVAERAMRVMEAAAGCAEGRAAICEAAEECVGAVLGRMMKVGAEGQEAAVAVLWGVCHAARDPRARAAVAGAAGGVQKILLLMQGDCSPVARRMSGELLRVFRVDPKSCLSAYNTKTTHIMPF